MADTYRNPWSPDGRQIALSVKTFRDSSKPGEVWVVNSDGTGLTSLTGDRVAAAGMHGFGAGGRKISFTAPVGKTTKLMLMNSDGSELQQLTHTHSSAPPSDEGIASVQS